MHYIHNVEYGKVSAEMPDPINRFRSKRQFKINIEFCVGTYSNLA